MRKRRNVILGLAIASWLAIACGSGVGALATVDDGYESPSISGRDNPGPGREVPSTTGRDLPPKIGDNPGSQGGGRGGGGGGAACPPCDVTLDCLVGTEKTNIPLKTVNGQCSAGKGVTFDCSGRVLQNGAVVGSWSGSGNSFTVTVSQQGQSQTLTCTKGKTTTVPTSTGTGTSTSPTGTTTSVPFDAGIKG